MFTADLLLSGSPVQQRDWLSQFATLVFFSQVAFCCRWPAYNKLNQRVLNALVKIGIHSVAFNCFCTSVLLLCVIFHSFFSGNRACAITQGHKYCKRGDF